MLARWLLQPSIRTLRFPTSLIISSFFFHSNRCIAFRSVDRIARSAEFLSLPPSLHVDRRAYRVHILVELLQCMQLSRPRSIHFLPALGSLSSLTQKIGPFTVLNIAQDFFLFLCLNKTICQLQTAFLYIPYVMTAHQLKHGTTSISRRSMNFVFA